MRRNDTLDVLHVRLRESPMLRDIRVIKIHAIFYNSGDDINKARQCIPHKLYALYGGFVGGRHEHSATLVDFKFQDCIYDTLNLSKLPLGLFPVLLNESDDIGAHLSVLRLEIVLQLTHFLCVFLDHRGGCGLEEAEEELSQFAGDGVCGGVGGGGGGGVGVGCCFALQRENRILEPLKRHIFLGPHRGFIPCVPHFVLIDRFQ